MPPSTLYTTDHRPACPRARRRADLTSMRLFCLHLGAEWTLVTAAAPWTDRYGHAVHASESGTLVLMGGVCWKTLQFFNGGYPPSVHLIRTLHLYPTSVPYIRAPSALA